MKVLPPKTASFRIKRLNDQMCRFRYEEAYGVDMPMEAIRNTKQIIAASTRLLKGLKVTWRGRKVVVEGRATTRMVASMIVGEFMPWSSFGEFTVAQLWGNAAFGALTEAAIDPPTRVGSPESAIGTA